MFTDQEMALDSKERRDTRVRMATEAFVADLEAHHKEKYPHEAQVHDCRPHMPVAAITACCRMLCLSMLRGMHSNNDHHAGFCGRCVLLHLQPCQLYVCLLKLRGQHEASRKQAPKLLSNGIACTRSQPHLSNMRLPAT